ncbi:MAG TPA: hypothetical protein VGR78_09595 [Verrucomicrobiae bacterium]|jgi:hypothetical protein|nr:hypothetical protein [Verrucomicrobiae bacterium]
MQTLNNDPDRVRANTQAETLQQIDSSIDQKILYYSTQPKEAISQRIRDLEREWDIERVLETNASALALSGLLLGLVRSRKYLLVSATVLGFLLLHGVQGWCPPIPLLRKAGVRTRSEIDREKFALKVLRGDFQEVTKNPEEFKEHPAAEVVSAVKQG